MIATSFKLPCGLTLPNRIVKAAMTERLSGIDARANEKHVRLYQRFAEGGAGMLLTGNVLVDGRYLEAPGNVLVEDDKGIDALKSWAQAGKSRGGAMIMQINHAGRQTPRSCARHSIAPSAVPMAMRNFFSEPRAMSETDIEETIGRFAFTASVAERAGFDGVELHAAHGYLISQFLSPRVNHRRDQWGGPIENRARLLVRVTSAIRAAVSQTFAVGVKLNVGDFIAGGFEPSDALKTISLLNDAGLDFLELSGGTHEHAVSFGFKGEQETPKEAYFRHYAQAVRQVTALPLVLTGGIRSRGTMEALLQNNVCDLIGMARPLATEPDLPRKLIRGEAEQAQFISLKLPKPPRDTLAELMWRRAQLVRMANGRDPKLSIFPTLSLIRMLFEERSYAKKRAAWLRREKRISSLL